MDNRSVEIEVLNEKIRQYFAINKGKFESSTTQQQDSYTCDEYIQKMNESIFYMATHQKCMPNSHISTKRYGIWGRVERCVKKTIRSLVRWYVIDGLQEQELFNQCSLATFTHGSHVINGIMDEINDIRNVEKTEIEKLHKELERQRELLNAQVQYVCKIDGKIEEVVVDYRNENNGVRDFWNKKTVSQSGEDAIIAYILMVLGIDYSTEKYLDLGANHARTLSNTYGLYERGMRGVLVEANRALIDELEKYREEDVIIHKCVSTKTGDKVPFYIMSGDGLSCMDREIVDQMISINPNLFLECEEQIETISVNDILSTYFEKGPIVLNIDIEGLEYDILSGLDYEKYAPFIIVVEQIDYSLSIAERKRDTKIDELLKNKGYFEYAFTGINSIYVNRKKLEEYRNENCD